MEIPHPAWLELRGYGHTDEGDLETVTDARGNTTTYSNYFRGQAQTESYPDLTSISRAVNPTGTVASLTSARGYTTSFSYDDINRLTSINFPVGDDVSIAWESNRKTLTRGAFTETIAWDGFNLPVSIERRDNDSGSAITTTTQYDVFGRAVFESLPNSSLGTSSSYDTLGRVLTQTNPDGTSRSYNYTTHSVLGGHAVEMLNENNALTVSRILYIGLDETYTMDTFSPEGMGTALHYDILGKLKSVTQGETQPDFSIVGQQDVYTYDDNEFLASVDRSGLVMTTYARDAVGNMTNKTQSVVSVNYTYDEMNRLTFIDYSDDAIDISYAYDSDGNVDSISNQLTHRSYDYDANGNLTSESLSVGANTYNTNYIFNNLDHLSQIEYPSGRSVTYAPDGLGRPSQAAPFVTGVTYFPNGIPERVTYANGLESVFSQDNRLRLATAQTGLLLSYDYDYDAVGNTTGIIDLRSSINTRSMTYDDLDRLTDASGAWGTATYAYDVYNNLVSKSDPKNGRSLVHTINAQRLNETLISPTNRVQTYRHDVLGNIIGVQESDDAVGGRPTIYRDDSYIFNHANQLELVSKSQFSGGQVTLNGPHSFEAQYDGEGHRARKHLLGDPDAYVDYAHAKSGSLLGEYSPDGPAFGHEYFYLGRQLVASAKLNAPPVADAPNVESLVEGGSITLAVDTTDSDGEVVAWNWEQISGPVGTIDDPTAEVLTFFAPSESAGSSVVLRFTATDDRGGEVVGEVTIDLVSADLSPELSILSPADGSTFVGNAIVEFQGVASDTEDGNISGAIEWRSDIDGPLGSGASLTVPDLSEATHVITASVTDSASNVTTSMISVTFQASEPPFEVIVDDDDSASVSTTGNWHLSSLPGWDGTSQYGNDSSSTFRWNFDVPVADTYDVYGWWPSHPNRSDRAPFTISHAGGSDTVEVNQQTGGGTWVLLGSYPLTPGGGHYVELSTVNGPVSADAIRVFNASPSTTGISPFVTVSSPVDGQLVISGTPVTLSASATDIEDGDLSGGIAWSSNIDGALGSGASLSISSLSEAVHLLTASVTDSDSNESMVAIEVTVLAPGQVIEIIVDDDDSASVSTTGNWHLSSLPGWDGTSQYGNDSSSTFRWNFDVPVADTYDVYGWWPSHPNRSDRAPFTISHAGGSDTVEVNQQTGGGTWVLLGSYPLTPGGGHYVELSTVNGPVSADAIRVFNASPSTTGISPFVTVSSPVDGQLVISGTPVTLSASATDIEDGDLSGGIAWSSNIDGALGSGASLSISSLSEAVHLLTASVTDSDSNESMVAIEVTVLAPGQVIEIIVDDDDSASVSTTGNWHLSSLPGWDGTSQYGNDSSSTFRWNFDVPVADTYDVYGWWPSHPNRSDRAPFTISHAGGSDTVEVNQQTGGGTWVLLGSYPLTPGGGHYVELSTVNGPVSADAIRVFRP